MATCNKMWGDLVESSNHLSTSPSFLQITGSFLSHPYTNTMEGFILLGEIYGSIYNHDLYDVGKSIAESMFKVIGNDELLDWMVSVREIEKQEKIDLEIEIAKEKAKAEL